MSGITIKESNQTITGWAKDIDFEYNGERHLVTLYWNTYDGYDLIFKNETNSIPEWAWKMIDVDNGEENLYEILDNLTESEAE
jgi:hypothetical protein